MLTRHRDDMHSEFSSIVKIFVKFFFDLLMILKEFEATIWPVLIGFAGLKKIFYLKFWISAKF